MATRAYEPVTVARQFKYVRELPGNKGQRVEAIQRWGGGKPGDSWCAFFATMVLDICYQGLAPLGRTGSCDDILRAARESNWVHDAPLPNDLYLRVKPGTEDAHHVGFVCAIEPDGDIVQISGNTSADGLSSNGDGVYERAIPHSADLVFVRMPN